MCLAIPSGLAHMQRAIYTAEYVRQKKLSLPCSIHPVLLYAAEIRFRYSY
jgi:hypothetical protein